MNECPFAHPVASRFGAAPPWRDASNRWAKEPTVTRHPRITGPLSAGGWQRRHRECVLRHDRTGREQRGVTRPVGSPHSSHLPLTPNPSSAPTVDAEGGNA